MGYSSSHPAPRARPVADLPLDELTGAGEDLARAWAVAMIVARPPSAIAEIPLEDLARDGPRLCAHVLRALQSEAELERLTGSQPEGAGDGNALARSVANLAGASDVASLVGAVEALRGVLWEALLAQLRRPIMDRADAHLLADLADRLAYVCAMTLSAAISPAVPRHARARGPDDVLVAETASVPPGRGDPMAPAGAGGRGEVVIVDERQHAASSPRVVVARGTSAPQEAERAGTAPAWSPPATAEPPSEPAWQSAGVVFPPASEPAPRHEPPGPDIGRPPAPPAQAVPEIQIRDERMDEGPAAWIRSIGGELERFALEGRPFAVILVGLMDAERLNREEPAEEMLRIAGRVQRTLESELGTVSERAGASLTRESPGRFWLIAPGIDALRAGSLAERFAGAVRRSVSHRGQPVEIAVGIAVCPADGVQAAALAAHADVALYAARAEGSAGDGPAR